MGNSDIETAIEKKMDDIINSLMKGDKPKMRLVRSGYFMNVETKTMFWFSKDQILLPTKRQNIFIAKNLTKEMSISVPPDSYESADMLD